MDAHFLAGVVVGLIGGLAVTSFCYFRFIYYYQGEVKRLQDELKNNS